MASRDKLDMFCSRMDIVMCRLKTVFLCFLMLTVLTAMHGAPFFSARNAYNAYKTKDFQKAQKLLEEEQIETPNDPLINYNLGNTYYKKDDYTAAKASYQRALAGGFGKHSPTSDFTQKARFNLGNTFYKNGLSMLPENWETLKDTNNQRLDQAANEVKQAIDEYEQVIKADPEHTAAKENNELAKELLAKLKKQQQQQKQDQKQDKKDRDKKDQKQNKQDQKDKQDDKKDQDKQDKKQDQNKDKQDKKDEKKEQDQQQQQQQKQEQQQKQQDQQQQQPQPVQDQNKKLEQQRAEAVLNKLKQDEKKLQKELFKQKVGKMMKPKNNYQKPW